MDRVRETETFTMDDWLAELDEPIYRRTARVSAKVAANDMAIFNAARGILHSG